MSNLIKLASMLTMFGTFPIGRHRYITQFPTPGRKSGAAAIKRKSRKARNKK